MVRFSALSLGWISLSLIFQRDLGLAEPQPLSVPPSKEFIGDDGPWSGFELGIGTPPQYVDVLVSTQCSETFVIVRAGCQQADPSGCPTSRGGLFESDASKTWKFEGNYTLSLDTNLGLNSPYDTGSYGSDNITLGYRGSGLQMLENQTIAATASANFWVGVFGISAYPTNLSGLSPNETKPTYLGTLRNLNIVPSLSWGYTGGAQYRLKGALASLTFGGYDASLFTPSGVSFDFAPNNNLDLSLYIQSIAYTDGTNKDVSLLPVANPGPFLTFIDSTAPAIWLPLSACLAFEKAFGLTWNETYGYYFVNDTLHEELTTSNPNITFTLSNTVGGGPRVNITLPYAAFDKTLNYGIGLINQLPSLESQKYFPLQRAANSSQYTLGRTFLQEAYIITDYERQNFTVNPCVWNQGAEQNLVPICSSNTTGCTSPMGSGPGEPTVLPPSPTKPPGSGLSTGAIVAIVVVILVIIVFAGYFWWWRRRRTLRKSVNIQTTPEMYTDLPGSDESEQVGKPHELHSTHITEICSTELAEIGASSKVIQEYYGEHPNDQVYELPVDGGILRQPTRLPNSNPSRPRTGSAGQESNVSELSDASPSSRARPSLSHRRNTSEQSKVSDASTLREDGDVSPYTQQGVSPQDGSGFSPMVGETRQ